MNWQLNKAILIGIIALTGCTSKSGSDRYAFEIFESKDTIRLLENDAKSPILTTDYFITYPVELGSSVCVDTIQNLIKSFVFSGNEHNSFEEMHRTAIDSMKKDYCANGEFYTQESEMGRMMESMNHFVWTKVTIPYFNKAFMLAEVYQTSYSGGAHGMYMKNFYMIDNMKGTRINEQDLFVPGYEELLCRVLTAESVTQNPCVSFFHDTKDETAIKPNNNFRIVKEGIIYTFNAYEVAPYSEGIVEITLRYDDLVDLLKPEAKVLISIL